MKTLTIFTPTYNRATTLVRTYESLCCQTCKDFEWLIIDDGSTDETADIVNKWTVENKIVIRYFKKENGGLHTGYIKAFELIETELNVCIDSDDYMPNDGVQKIIDIWDRHGRGHNEIVGIIGLDFIHNTKKAIGGNFPDIDTKLHFYEMQQVHHGDTKQVVRTDLIKKIEPMMSFPPEKNFNPVYYFWMLDYYGKYIVTNDNLCFVDYQSSGMSANIFYQYRNSPRSFAQYRRYYMSLPWMSTSKNFRNAIHYVSSCIFSRQWNGIRTSPKKILTILVIIPGIILNLYIRYKTRIN